MPKVRVQTGTNSFATVYTSDTVDQMITGSGGEVTVPTHTSELINDTNYVSDASYVHTDNNYTTVEKTKLSGIENNANNYTHPVNHPASIITEDATHRFATDTEKSTWNSKAAGTHTHTKSQITDYADYVHPTNHPPSIITQDASNRFVTDTEKATWNAKQDALSGDVLGHYHTSDRYTHPASHPATMITEDATHRFTTDTEKSTWNSKQNALSGDVTTHYHTADRYTHPATHSADIIVDGTTNKAYTSTEKTKLSAIENNANNYTHPSTHSADIIIDGVTNKAFTNTLKTNYDTAYTNNHTHSNKALIDTYDQTNANISNAVTKAHDAVTVLDSTTIDFTLTGQQITGSVISNTSCQKIQIKKAGTLAGTRKGINLIEGSNVSITVSDDSLNDDVDITINATSSGGATISDTTVSTISVWSSNKINNINRKARLGVL